VTTDLPAPRLKMSGAVRIIPQRALMACVKKNFIFTVVDGSEGSAAPPSHFVLEEMYLKKLNLNFARSGYKVH